MSEEEFGLNWVGGGLWVMIRSLSFILREIEIYLRGIVEERYDLICILIYIVFCFYLEIGREYCKK